MSTAAMRPFLTRAIRVQQFGAPEVLKVQTNVELPPLKPDQVLLRVVAFGVNPSETYVRAGQYAYLPELPYTPGKDCAGLVVETGDSPSVREKFQKGDRVYTTFSTVSGCYAEHTIAQESTVQKLPDGYTFAQGAALGIPFYTAYRALIEKAGAKKGMSLLVHGGSGAVGVGSRRHELVGARGERGGRGSRRHELVGARGERGGRGSRRHELVGARGERGGRFW